MLNVVNLVATVILVIFAIASIVSYFERKKFLKTKDGDPIFIAWALAEKQIDKNSEKNKVLSFIIKYSALITTILYIIVFVGDICQKLF